MKKKAKEDPSESSNAYERLAAVWKVLRENSSKDNPLSVKQIHQFLSHMENAPSPLTLERIMPEAEGVLSELFPGILSNDERRKSLIAYLAGRKLHVVIETPEGAVLKDGGIDLEWTRKPFKFPSYSTVDNMLKSGILLNINTFPYALRCVAANKEGGNISYISYDDWEDRLEQNKTSGKTAGTEMNEPAVRNNKPRLYYLTNALTDGEWRLLSDLIQVYPYISEEQTEKFLAVVQQLMVLPKKSNPAPSRYAFKHGNNRWIENINCLDRAIRKKQKVRLIYGAYELKKREQHWKPVLTAHKIHGELDIVVAPYALMWSNGYYYLVCHEQGMMNLRVDRILSAEILEGEEGKFTLPPDFDPVEYRDKSPVMYPGKPTPVRMRCKTGMINILLDFFGAQLQFTAPTPEGETEVMMNIAPSGVKLFALQYAGSVEVLEPAELREEIRSTLEDALKKYRKAE